MEIIDKEPNPQKRLDEFIDIEVAPFNWRAYNNSQTREKIMFLALLDDLCNLLDNDKFSMCGRKPKSLSLQVFCVCLKAYTGFSSRRLISEIELCRRRGHIGSVPHFNSVLNYLNSKQVNRALKYLIPLSALPLAQLEKSFAVDSSGFSERRYLEKWSNIKQKHYLHQQYKKAHCIYGTYSNVIVDCIITKGTEADSPKFKELLKNAVANFNVKEVVADLAYSSRENLQYAEELGVTPYIPFKKNATGKAKGAIIWNKMYKYFRNNNEEFMQHYHQRSNAESGFFMIKQILGEYVTAKNDLAQYNELLSKVLCQNLRVLIQEIFLSKVEVDFLICAKKYIAQKED